MNISIRQLATAIGNEISEGLATHSRVGVKMIPDLSGLAIDLCKWGEYFFGSQNGSLIKLANDARVVFGGVGFSVSLAKLAENPTDLVISGLKIFKDGRSFISELGKRNIIYIPSCIDRYGFTGNIAGVIVSGVELYTGGCEILDYNEKLTRINLGLQQMVLDPANARRLAKGCEKLRWQSFIKVTKCICKIASAIFSLIAIYTGAAVVSGVVLLSLSTIGNVCGMIKHYSKDYRIDESHWVRNKMGEEFPAAAPAA